MLHFDGKVKVLEVIKDRLYTPIIKYPGVNSIVSKSSSPPFVWAISQLQTPEYRDRMLEV